MKKIIEIVKKHDNIFVYIYMIAALSVYIFGVKLKVGDELWNFSFIYKFTNGYKLYGDLNVLITPLFHYIGNIVFLILENNFISFRIYNILIYSTLFTTIYILFKKLKVEKINAFFYILIIFFGRRGSIVSGANYNVLAMVFIIVGIILELNKNSKKNDILKGLNLFCIFMTKQNVFVYYCIALVILYIMQIKQITIKERIIKLSISFSSFIIPFIIFIIYLCTNNTLYDFVSYCFLGINEFGTQNIYLNMYVVISNIIIIVAIAVSILLIKIKKIDKQIKDINYIFMPFQVMMLFYAYPIINAYHIKLAILIATILLIYNLHNIFLIEFIDRKKMIKVIKICILIVTIYFIGYNSYVLWEYKNSDLKNHDIKPYNGILIENDIREKIINICEYVKENERQGIETKLISREANLYMNILEKNNKNMDLPFLGNLGKEGEEGLILEVQNLKQGTKILIDKEKFWQDSDKLRNMIINEYKKIGEIEDFYIHEK